MLLLSCAVFSTEKSLCAQLCDGAGQGERFMPLIRYVLACEAVVCTVISSGNPGRDIQFHGSFFA